MSDARLLELQEMRTSIRRQIYAMYGSSYEEDIADAVDEIDRLRAENAKPRPLGPVDHLAVQTSYASVAFIVAHLRRYFESYEEAGTEPDLPKTLLDAADRAAAVLNRMRQGDQQQWGHIVETMTRAANLLDGTEAPTPEARAEVVIPLYEAIAWMRSGGER